MRKNVLEAYNMLDNQSLASSFTSSVTSVKNLDKASLILEWSGGPATGTVLIEARNKREPVGAESPWIAVDFDTISVSGASGTHTLIFNELPFSDIRISYTASSGSGLMKATLFGKQVGG